MNPLESPHTFILTTGAGVGALFEYTSQNGHNIEVCL